MEKKKTKKKKTAKTFFEKLFNLKNKKGKKKKKAFTLIELLAVIVILGVIMIIAIPSVTSYITNSRKDSYIADAKMFVNAAKTMLTANATLPQEAGGKVVVPIQDIELDKGGEKSPYGNDWNYEYSYVEVVNIGTSSDPEYVWKVMLEDTKGNCIPLTDMNALRREVVGTGCSEKMNFLVHEGTVPDGGVYYSGITYLDVRSFDIEADRIYVPGDEFPDVIYDGDIYMYGDYIYGYNVNIAADNVEANLDSGGILFMSNSYTNLDFDEEIGGWSVAVLDYNKTKYENILESINGAAITSLRLTFGNCQDMIEAPKIPDTVNNMYRTFDHCESLKRPPVLPSSLTNMYRTFYHCLSLEEMPVIPANVVNMYDTFGFCESMKKGTNIPANVNELFWTFRGCINLTGEIKVDVMTSVNNLDYAFVNTEKSIILTGNAPDDVKYDMARRYDNILY